MNDALIVLVPIFFVSIGFIWLALHFGTKLFKKRQEAEMTQASNQLANMFIFTDSNKFQLFAIAGLILLPVLAWIVTSNLLAVAVCVILAFLAPRWIVKHLAQKRLLQIEQQLPDALLMIVGALRAGSSLPLALESLVNEGKPPISQEFDLLTREMRLGVDFTVALRNLEKRVPLQDLAMVTAGMALSREVGANLAETLDSIGKTIRAKLQMEGKIRSLTAQGKMQGIVMAGLPIFLILILQFMEPEAMAPLFSTWYGYATLAVIGVAIGIGYFFIRKITTIDV
jgi:tight adherence protein B